MLESNSSEEEVFKKRRFSKKTTKTKDLESLFDEENNEESYEEPNLDDNERSTIFNEIFGTGREYFYVLEETEEEEASEETVVEPELSPEDCKRYVVWNTNITNRNLERFVDLLLKGYVLNYVMLHDIDYDIDIYTGMKIEKYVQRYKDFLEYRSRFTASYIEEIYSYDALKYIPQYEEARKKYKEYGTNKYFLSVEQFETNLKDREAVFIPCSYEEEEAHVDFNEEEYVFQLSTSIVIRDYFVQLYRIYGRIEEEEVYKYFLSQDTEDRYNEKRREILSKVLETIKMNESEIKENLQIEEQEKALFNRIVDRIYNGSLRRLRGEERVVCCTKDNNLFKGVVIDHKGQVVEKFSKNRNEFDLFLDEISPHCVLLGGFSPTIRLAMQQLIGRNCLYVENTFFPHLKKEKYEFCKRIGRLALYPEIEYIRLYFEGTRGWKELVEGCTVHDVSSIVKRAILTSISMTGIDLNLILSQEDRIKILSFLGLHSISKIFSVEEYTSLSELQDVIPNRVEYINLLTYIRLFKEYSKVKNELDEKPVHVENYFILEESRLGEGENDYQRGVQRDDTVTGLRVTKRDTKRIEESVVHDYRPVFQGFPDSIAFKNLSGSSKEIVGSVLEGRVFFVDEGYVLVSVLNNVTVFCRTQDKHFPNQMVKIRIEEVNEAFVSFNGVVVQEETPKAKYPRFCKHPLYKEVDSQGAIDYLQQSNELVLLRRSTRDNSPVLVFKFYESIYAQFKLDTSYSFRGKEYKSIEEVLILVKKTLRNVQEITRHKHFYKTEGEALEKVGEEGDYIKYGFYFPREYPGRLCFVFNRGRISREYLGVYDALSYEGRDFDSIEDFLMYRKGK